MNYESTVTLQSKLFPDVSYTLRKMTRGRRIEFDQMMAAEIEQSRQLTEERELIEEEIKPLRDTAKAGPCTCSHEEIKHDPTTFACLESGCNCRAPVLPAEIRQRLTKNLNADRLLERTKFQPAIVRWGVVSITGLDIDGNPAQPDDLVARGPESLVDEIVQELTIMMALTDAERKNSGLPTTSGVPVDGQKSAGGAPAANGTKSTSKEPVETAVSSFQGAFV